MKKSLLFLIGILSLILGILGVFLPLLPTTPFAILSLFCFERSSPRFHAYCMSIPILGESVTNWNEKRIISKKSKISAISLIFISILCVWLFQKVLWVRLFVTIVLALVSFFILKQKS